MEGRGRIERQSVRDTERERVTETDEIRIRGMRRGGRSLCQTVAFRIPTSLPNFRVIRSGD